LGKLPYLGGTGESFWGLLLSCWIGKGDGRLLGHCTVDSEKPSRMIHEKRFRKVKGGDGGPF